MMQHVQQYCEKLRKMLDETDWSPLTQVAEELLEAVSQGRSVYLCGNGGSAGNAMHLANDFLYGISPDGNALKVEALSSNSAVLTCLGNDIGYENIYSHQLKVKAQSEDILIVLSGSGNSPNIVNALRIAKPLNVKSFAILGFDGGLAKHLADHVMHFDINDMQVAEDLQLITGHMLMQSLKNALDGNKNG